MRKLFAQAFACMLPVLVLTSAASAEDRARAVVTNAVQVTADANPVRAHATLLLARNPKNEELVVADVDVRGSRECEVHISSDGGRSWFAGGDLHVKPFTDCSMAGSTAPTSCPSSTATGCCTWSPPPTTPRTCSTSQGSPRRSFLETAPSSLATSTARSSDGGRAFDVRLVYQGPKEDPHHGYNYAPVGAVDPENPSFVYVGWTQGEWQSPKEPSEAVVSASSDGGTTFALPYDISQLSGSEHAWHPSDGEESAMPPTGPKASASLWPAPPCPSRSTARTPLPSITFLP